MTDTICGPIGVGLSVGNTAARSAVFSVMRRVAFVARGFMCSLRVKYGWLLLRVLWVSLEGRGRLDCYSNTDGLSCADGGRLGIGNHQYAARA